MAAPQSQFARTADGAQVACWTLGQGPPLVMLDVRCDGDIDWEWEIPEVRAWYERLAQGRQLVGLGMRSWSTPEEARTAHSMVSLTCDLEAVVNHLHIDSFALWGAWVSGPVAIRYAALHPGQLTHLILYATFASAPEIIAREDVDAVHAMIPVDHRTWTDVIWQQATGYAARALADRLATRWKRRWDAASEAASIEATREFDAREQLGKIVTPTLVLDRPDYSLLPSACARELAREIANARLVTSPGPGLLPYAGDFSETADAIDTFLGAEAAVRPTGDVRLVIFTDVEASTALIDRFGDLAARDILREHERLTRAALSQHGGTEIKTMGDGFLASFTSASAALDAAIAMQRAITAHFAETATPIRIRVGINAGEPIEEDADLYGTAVIRAARIMGQAQGGEVLVSDLVRGLVAGKPYTFHGRGTHTLKGFEEPVRLFALGWE